MAIKVNVFTKKWLSQQKYRKERDNLKPVGLSLHSKKLNSPIKPRMLIPRKKHPQALDIKYMTCREAACPMKVPNDKNSSVRGAPNDIFLHNSLEGGNIAQKSLKLGKG